MQIHSRHPPPSSCIAFQALSSFRFDLPELAKDNFFSPVLQVMFDGPCWLHADNDQSWVTLVPKVVWRMKSVLATLLWHVS